MNTFENSELTINTSTGYKVIYTLKYKKEVQHRWESISGDVTYTPEFKSWSFGELFNKNLIKLSIELQETIPQFILNHSKNELQERAYFFDRVHEYLNKDSIQLTPTEVKKTMSTKVKRYIETYDESEKIEVGLGIKYDDSINHFNLSNIRGRTAFHVSFGSEYLTQFPVIQKAYNDIRNNTDIRLILLFD